MSTRQRFSYITASLFFVSMLFFQQLSLGDSWSGVVTSNANVFDGIQKLNNAIALYIGSPKAIVNNINCQVDTTNAEVTPIVENARTLVPIRFIAENLGAKVEWNSNSNTVNVLYNNKQISLVIGSKTMLVGNDSLELETPAKIEKGRTLVPLRALAEGIGKQVFYDRGLIVISDNRDLFNINAEKEMLDEIISKINVLPTVGSYEKLMELVNSSFNYTERVYVTAPNEESVMSDSIVQNSKGGNSTSKAAMSPQASLDSKMESSAGGSSDYSKTNVQVEGVDEADIVKTDGEYIYQVNKGRIIVSKAYPADEMKVVSVLTYPDQEFNPQEIYVDEKYLVVIGSTRHFTPHVYDSVKPQDGNSKMIAPPMTGGISFNTMKMIAYDITDKSNIKNIREVEIEGNYVSSRKIGSSLYFISNRSLYYYRGMKAEDKVVPAYRDTAINNEFKDIDYGDIQYFPKLNDANYMIVAGLDLDKTDEKVNIATYLGAGQNIYVSNQNMYVALTQYDYMQGDKINSLSPQYYRNEPGTLIYKFSLNKGKTTYLSKGSVLGTILNQFSMDEYDKHFRIATTRNNVQLSDNSFNSTNNLYILDETMNLSGKIEDIAPGERIYSTRFIGKRGYMVTFKTIDPLFVMDLGNPREPKVLGSLKIPGFSNYLHPYDENHIIGFGKDTADNYGRVTVQGMKMAIFDVSDVNDPKEKFVEIIGDAGTDSPLLNNHKALLFSKEKNLLAFPVTVMENNDQNKTGGYGQFSFQGAYVYDIDLEKGFSLKGRITHISEEEYLKSGSNWYNSERNIERLLYIDELLYTLSKGMIKSNDLNDLKTEYELTMPN